MGWSTKNKRGRPKKVEAEDTFDRVQIRRKLYAWIRPDERKNARAERDGTIDQDVCDGIGQLCALGLLEIDGFQPIDLRDKGREWRNHLMGLLRPCGFKTGRYERASKGHHHPTYTKWDEMFDEADNALKGFERKALYSLLVDPLVGSYPDGRENACWVESLICEALLKMGKFPPAWMLPIPYPTMNDRALLDAAVKGLTALAADTKMRRAA